MTESRNEPKKVLIVDDELHILQVLTLKLRNAGYDVMTAVDGEEGLEVATRENPDLIITDFQMPYMSGLELCQALAKDAASASIPVLLLTARGYALDDSDLSIGNIRKVLTKPFSPRSIVQQVNEELGGSDWPADSAQSSSQTSSFATGTGKEAA